MLEAQVAALPASSLVRAVGFQSIVSIAAFRGRDLGMALPVTPRRVVVGGVTYLWNGPNAWLAISEGPGLFEEISSKLAGVAAVTEQSDGFYLFRVIGPNVRRALAKLVPIDLHPSEFPPDAVALTLAAHLAVRIWQAEDGAFLLACFRSFAGALHHALLEACAEFEQG